MNKFFVFVFMALLTLNNAVSSDVITGITLSPFVFATKLLEVTSVGVGKLVASTSSLVRSRSFAEKEELKDEILDLNNKIMSGEVRHLDDLSDGYLKELFEEILLDEVRIKEVHSLVQDGDLIYKLTVTVIFVLFEPA